MLRADNHPVNDRNKILIVEDSPTQATKLRYMLADHGFAVLSARSGQEALAILAEKIPALIISDVIMPEMDGFELCTRIRDEERTRNVPIILLTSLSDPLDIIKGLACGADTFITKPWNEPHMMSRIQYIFDNLALREQDQPQFVGEVLLDGEKHLIKSAPFRMLSYLFFSYETAIQRNRELMEAQEELRYLSTHDILTGLYNRTFFDEELKRLSRGRQFPVSVLSADVDGLKAVNDGQGHAAGDRLLGMAAEAIAGAFRAGDVVARIGGDEFCVLLPDADAHVVADSMLRIRKRLEEINAGVGDFQVSISLGAATAYTADELAMALKASDASMYLEKFARKREALEAHHHAIHGRHENEWLRGQQKTGKDS